ncbi:MAG: FAD-binding oxidoreductase [Anaerolineae bacterium]
MTAYDVILAGGGVMGCAIAYFLLKRDPVLRIAIIEKDPTYRLSSTVLSDGNMRIQFNIKENILISQYGFKLLEHFSDEMAVGDKKPDVQFRHQGNFFLADGANREATLAGMRLQQSLGAEVEWLEAEVVQQRYPFIAPEPIAGGTFSPHDGTMDPYSVLLAYKDKSIDLGAEFIVGEVSAINAGQGRVEGVTLADGRTLSTRYVVNSAGAWGVELARGLGIELPIAPTMRHVFHFEAPVTSDTPLPLIVFPSGLYIHHENANHFLVGKSLPVDEVGYDFTFKRQLFTDYLWEDLAHYIPEFERVKLIDGWAGLYDVNTFDGNALLGEWPEIKGLMLVIGFSGHGFQQCHAVGAYLADVMLGRVPELDLEIFSPARLLTKQPVYENAHKLV